MEYTAQMDREKENLRKNQQLQLSDIPDNFWEEKYLPLGQNIVMDENNRLLSEDLLEKMFDMIDPNYRPRSYPWLSGVCRMWKKVTDQLWQKVCLLLKNHNEYNQLNNINLLSSI